jgi:hypothetical protein
VVAMNKKNDMKEMLEIKKARIAFWHEFGAIPTIEELTVNHNYAIV